MTAAPKAPAYYLRVSTAAQDYPAQLHAIKEYCRRQGWPAPTKKNLFAEKISGSKASRRELDRLLQACREGAFDCIVTYRADRIGRSLLHLVNIYGELERIKIRVIGIADNVDTADGSPTGKAFRNMLATFAELTRETIVESVRAGQAAAAKEGRHAGRPRKNDERIERALAMAAKGKTGREISTATGLSPSYVSMLRQGKRRPKKSL